MWRWITPLIGESYELLVLLLSSLVTVDSISELFQLRREIELDAIVQTS